MGQGEIRQVGVDRIQAKSSDVGRASPGEHAGDIPTPKRLTLLFALRYVVVPDKVGVHGQWRALGSHRPAFRSSFPRRRGQIGFMIFYDWSLISSHWAVPLA